MKGRTFNSRFLSVAILNKVNYLDHTEPLRTNKKTFWMVQFVVPRCFNTNQNL